MGQDAGALGAAALAAVGAGLWPDFSPVETVHQAQDLATPVVANAGVYDALLRAVGSQAV